MSFKEALAAVTQPEVEDKPAIGITTELDPER